MSDVETLRERNAEDGATAITPRGICPQGFQFTHIIGLNMQQHTHTLTLTSYLL